jgi:putative sigma-54 modulation protein
MEINVTFRHTENSEVLKQHIFEKMQKFAKYFIKPVIAHVTLNVEGSRHIVEISLAESHVLFNAKEKSHDMYYSLDVALGKIERQLKKYKEKIKSHHKKTRRTLSQPKLGIAI